MKGAVGACTSVVADAVIYTGSGVRMPDGGNPSTGGTILACIRVIAVAPVSGPGYVPVNGLHTWTTSEWLVWIKSACISYPGLLIECDML